eukprot:TRINITY_DN1667_c0_g1_i4.p1 TRINITY_DN1667_c0_g1~~TRINITY_DN1667_c0_g1_i4.p1  ORF type:complete len:1279 (+),score=221.66 TRINITY_DN1667_c0_g1_i4:241-4077(+)
MGTTASSSATARTRARTHDSVREARGWDGAHRECNSGPAPAYCDIRCTGNNACDSTTVQGNSVVATCGSGACGSGGVKSKQGNTLPPVAPPAVPTASPTQGPTTSPTRQPSLAPSASPAKAPTKAPSAGPVAAPSASPARAPTKHPSAAPIKAPSRSPSASPARAPTKAPSASPARAPTKAPSASPARSPSKAPSASPAKPPSRAPSVGPSTSPAKAPTRSPSLGPAKAPSKSPSVGPSASPAKAPTRSPSASPVRAPTKAPLTPSSPTVSPQRPTASPSASPSGAPLPAPTQAPTGTPSAAPAAAPTKAPLPAAAPTVSPKEPTASPSAGPSGAPTRTPTAMPVAAAPPPSANPTAEPSSAPQLPPTRAPQPAPTKAPQPAPTKAPQPAPTKAPLTAFSPTQSPVRPTTSPSTGPTHSPTAAPSRSPLPAPTASPSRSPLPAPTASPSRSPQRGPTAAPTVPPIASPSTAPTRSPQRAPTAAPTRGPRQTPTAPPSRSPFTDPTARPTAGPQKAPTPQPSAAPRARPTRRPSAPPAAPTLAPSAGPSGSPGPEPTAQPSRSPWTPMPTAPPSTFPTRPPSSTPSRQPSSVAPSVSPSNTPTVRPTVRPSTVPTSPPSAPPTTPPVTAAAPSNAPTTPPSAVPSARPSAPPTHVREGLTPEDKETVRAIAGPLADGGAAVTAAAGMAAAANAGKLAVVSGLGCEVEDVDVEGDEPLDWEFHPLKFPIGDHHKYFLGSLVGNTIVVGTFVAIQLCGCYLLKVLYGTPLGRGAGVLKFPGAVYIPLLFVLQGTSLSASNMLFHPGNSPAYVPLLGAVYLILCFLCPVLLWWKVLRPWSFRGALVQDESLDKKTGCRRKTHVFVFGDLVWVTQPRSSAEADTDHFAEQWDPVFGLYREGCLWFACAELLHILILSLLANWRAAAGAECHIRNSLVCLLLGTYFGLAVWRWPCISPMDNTLLVLQAGLIFVAVLLLSASIAAGEAGGSVHAITEMAVYCLLITSFIMFTKAVYDIAVLAVDVCTGRRSEQRARTRKRALEKPEIKNLSLDESGDLEMSQRELSHRLSWKETDSADGDAPERLLSAIPSSCGDDEDFADLSSLLVRDVWEGAPGVLTPGLMPKSPSRSPAPISQQDESMRRPQRRRRQLPNMGRSMASVIRRPGFEGLVDEGSHRHTAKRRFNSGNPPRVLSPERCKTLGSLPDHGIIIDLREVPPASPIDELSLPPASPQTPKYSAVPARGRRPARRGGAGAASWRGGRRESAAVQQGRRDSNTIHSRARGQ